MGGKIPWRDRESSGQKQAPKLMYLSLRNVETLYGSSFEEGNL